MPRTIVEQITTHLCDYCERTFQRELDAVLHERKCRTKQQTSGDEPVVKSARHSAPVGLQQASFSSGVEQSDAPLIEATLIEPIDVSEEAVVASRPPQEKSSKIEPPTLNKEVEKEEVDDDDDLIDHNEADDEEIRKAMKNQYPRISGDIDVDATTPAPTRDEVASSALTCKLCARTLKSARALQRHLNVGHKFMAPPLRPAKRETPDIKPRVAQYMCHVCKREYKNVGSMRRHINLQHPDTQMSQSFVS